MFFDKIIYKDFWNEKQEMTVTAEVAATKDGGSLFAGLLLRVYKAS